MIEAGGWIEGWWMMCEFRWREMSVPLSRRRYTYPNLSPRFWGRDAGPGSRVRWIAGRDIAEFGTQIRTAVQVGLRARHLLPSGPFSAGSAKFDFEYGLLSQKPVLWGKEKGYRECDTPYFVICTYVGACGLLEWQTRYPAHWVAEVSEDAAVFHPSPSHNGPKKGIPRRSGRRALVHSRNGGAKTLLFPWGLSVMWDESKLTKFPFLVLVHVTLLTLAQARLSPCSGWLTAAHPNYRFQRLGRSVLNCFNSNRVGLELVLLRLGFSTSLKGL